RRDLQNVRLRRAVSTAYYSLFHLLLESASAQFANDLGLQALISRAFAHGEMEKVARTFRSGEGSLPAHVRAVFSGVIPPEIQQVAAAFTDLQQARHEADYDHRHTVTPAQARDLVNQAELAFPAWNVVRAD